MSVAIVAIVATAMAGCIPRSDEPLRRQTDDDAGGLDPTLLEPDRDASADRRPLPELAPHAVRNVEPAHGPFSGGQLAVVRGNGFRSDVRVWFGGREVAAEDVVAIDPTRVQVVVPPGDAGLADVATQNGDDASTLTELGDGYHYDEFYLDPVSGPTSGGSNVTVRGDGTDWDDETQVFIDLEPCEVTEVVSETELVCRTPAGTPGAKPARVVTGDDVSVDVLDAFTYGDSENGFRGGLSGDQLDGELTVLVLDNFLGRPIPGATVIAGTSLDAAEIGKTNSGGLVGFDDLDAPQTVTVAAHCFQPVSFVDVEVDAVTAYLDPVLSPDCGSLGDGELPGGTSVVGARVSGELVWPQSQEFRRSGWTNVPAPVGEDEELVAYVFRLSSDPTGRFSLPGASSAVRPNAAGEAGFEFALTTLPGNLTLYALAGIENRSLNPPLFVAYAMGLIRGVAAQPGATTQSVFIRVDVPLDHALELTTSGPKPTSRGPDRLLASTALRITSDGYALLPDGIRSGLLPGEHRFEFVGVPPLIGSLAGAEYVVSAAAVTGISSVAPLSVVGSFATSVPEPIVLDDFVEIPVLSEPAPNGAWNGTGLAVDWAPGGASVDLVVFQLTSGAGLKTWTVAVPGGKKDVTLPDLGALDAELGLFRGPLDVVVHAARIDDFVYGTLRYRQLTPRGWNAYASDVYFARY